MTPDQIKRHLRDRGITIKQWAEEHGFAHEDVYQVLQGRNKASFGKGHRIAVALGLKKAPAEQRAA